jgi:ATP-binding cassette subfamily B protein
MRRQTPREQSDLVVLRRLLKQARPYWGYLAAIFVIDMFASPLALLIPLPLMLAVDSVIGSEPLPWFLELITPGFFTDSKESTLALIAILVVLFALFAQAQKLGSWLLQTYTGEKLVLAFRARLLRHAQRLSLTYHDTKGTSDSIYRIQYDAPAIQWVVIYGLTPFVTASLILVGMIFVTAQIDWQLALIALAVSPVLFVLTQVFRRRLRGQWRDVKQLEHSALSIIQEVLGALRVVRAYGQEDREYGRFLHRSSEGLWARIRVVIGESAFNLSVGLTIALGTAAVLYVGAIHVQAGILTLGQLLLVMAYLAQLYQPLQTLGQQVTKLQGGLTSAERAYALLDEASDVVDRLDAQALDRAKGAIEFDDVSFSYDGIISVLHNIAFRLPAGAIVGIKGRTGSGKTTLMNLLMRFYDPNAGRILLDDIDLRDYRLADLRDQFAIVLQDPLLLSSSIAENIAYARPDASEQEIIDAARAANVDEFIRALPQGYDTQVGERGLRLSGGQRQRIALARAFLKDAPILILDEPTSSVDVESEAAIMEAMDRLARGRTTLMIAHRLSTLERCEIILVLGDGHLVELSTVAAPVAVVRSG